MRTLTTISDPSHTTKSEKNFIENFFLNRIKDERDLPFIHLALQITFTIIPLAIVLFTNLLTGWMWWTAAAFYLALVVFFMGPYTLMLHNTSHRQFFKRDFKGYNNYIPWVLGPFMGQSPETYFGHHIGMHHSENNMYADKSSTLPYQRDSVRGFLHYYGSFMFIGIFEVVQYFTKKKLPKYRKMLIRGEFLFWLMCIGLGFANFPATLFVFILPLIVVRFGMMSGNWAQHAFVDKNQPANSFLNSITCINHLYNRRCFNDGYHIGHHLSPHRHWTDMPTDFLKNKSKYAENKAIVFEGIDYMGVWFLLISKRYDKLADHFVNIDGQFGNKVEVVALLKERTKKF
jgi:fatty acid desaturase